MSDMTDNRYEGHTIVITLLSIYSLYSFVHTVFNINL